LILYWFIILFASSLLISQTAMDVFSFLTSLSVLWLGYRWREQHSRNKLFMSVGWDWLFLAWFVITLIGIAVAGFPGESWKVLIDFKWLIVFYLLLTGIKYMNPTERLVTPFAIVFAVCSFYAVLVWVIGFDPIFPDRPLQTFANGLPRSGGFLYQPIVFAQLYSLPLCLLAGLFLSYVRWKERGRWWLLTAIIIGCLAILFSFTRGVWISVSLAFLIMSFLVSRRLGFSLLICSLLLFGGLYKFWPGFRDRIEYALNGGDSERLWIWQANLEMFRDHPIIGVGYGQNVPLLEEYYHKIGAPSGLIISHAHNQYLQMLSGTGALGFTVWLTIMLYFLSLAYRVWKKVSARNPFHQGFALGLIGAQAAFLLGGLTEANLEHAKMKYALMFIWAFTVWLAYEYRVIREKI
jgi:hypothetical protein